MMAFGIKGRRDEEEVQKKSHKMKKMYKDIRDKISGFLVLIFRCRRYRGVVWAWKLGWGEFLNLALRYFSFGFEL